MATAFKVPSRRRESIYLALTLLPIGLVAITLLAGFVREALCSSEVDSMVTDLRIAGEPTDALSLATAETVALPEATWAEQIKINNAAEHLNSRYTAVLQKFPNSGKLVPPGEPLECEKILAKFSEDAKPFFNGEGETFSNHEPLQLLDREFRTAYHAGDRIKAVNMLTRIGFDSALILESLQFDFWTSDDLRKLREMAEVPSNLEKQWKDFLSTSRGDYLVFVDGVTPLERNRRYRDPLDNPFGVAPSHKLAQLLYYDRASELHNFGSQNAMRAAVELESTDKAFSLVSAPLAQPYSHPIFAYRVSQLSLARMNKRRVITAIAIKQFKLQEGRWPESLDELTKVGLTSSDWKIVGNQGFGYRVVEDGNAVLLWTAGDANGNSLNWYEENFRTPLQPPSEVILNTSTIAQLQSTIR